MTFETKSATPEQQNAFKQNETNHLEWPTPEEITKKTSSQPYPLDALPPIIREAVTEINKFMQAPVAIVGTCALSAVSLTVQAHINVRRSSQLKSPIGLFTLTIAESGERKSSCDNYFTQPIIDYERHQEELFKPEIEKFKAGIDVWTAEKKGVADKIRQDAKAGKDTEKAKQDLGRLHAQKPEPLKIPRLIYSDVTPEQLAYCLAKGWPSGGIISSEAGAVFGSHSMSEDSVMKNLSQLNQLWDGGRLSVDRRTTESFTVNGARLTVALQVQEPTIRKFFQRAGDLARGSGFMARFLIAWPESTQGNRLWVEPGEMPAHKAYKERLTDILNNKVELDIHGRLNPATITFTPAAKDIWVDFFNSIEKSLKTLGELADIKDIASKAADNIARLAALFQYFEDGEPSEINEENVTNAGRLVLWHLSESQRFFNELSLPRTLADSVKLDGWLARYCKENHTHIVGRNYARKYSPIRDSTKLTTAIDELVNLDRVRIEKTGKKMAILVNPALLR